MKVGVLGTGRAGKTLAGKLVELGHDVMLGSRTADNPEAAAWAAEAGPWARVGTFADVAEFADLMINATAGSGSLDAIGSCDEAHLKGKILLDVSNPLDHSRGFPPILSVLNDNSLAERIQAAFPDLRVVKTFNTVSAPVMVDPGLVPGHHSIFLSGNDADAKAEVSRLQQTFGWPSEDIIDLGDITTARGAEMYLPIWLRIMGVVGSPVFNIHVVRGEG